MRLKKNYSSREVAALTGLSAGQLRWWDARRVMAPSIPPRRTPAGGFTERRYSPVDLLELLVLADLRRRGFSVNKIRRLLDTLRDRFGVRLFEVIGGSAPLRLLTDGRQIYARTAAGDVFDVLRAPAQPFLVIGEQPQLRELTARVRPRRRKTLSRAPRSRLTSASPRTQQNR